MLRRRTFSLVAATLTVVVAFSGCGFKAISVETQPLGVTPAQTKQLDASWAPQSSAIVDVFHLGGSTNLSNASALAPDLGSHPATVTNGDGSSFGFTAGHNGNALNFDGVNAHDFDIPRPVQDDFTINFWLKTSSTDPYDGTTCPWWGGAGLINGDTAGTADDLGLSLCGGHIEFGTGHPDVVAHSVHLVNDGIWHMITATRVRTTGTVTLYIDGQPDASNTMGGTQSLTATAMLRVGANPTSSTYYGGLLEDIGFWSTALTASEVAVVYAHQN